MSTGTIFLILSKNFRFTRLRLPTDQTVKRKSMFRGADEVNWNLCESVDFQRFFEANEISPAPIKKTECSLSDCPYRLCRLCSFVT